MMKKLKRKVSALLNKEVSVQDRVNSFLTEYKKLVAKYDIDVRAALNFVDLKAERQNLTKAENEKKAE